MFIGSIKISKRTKLELIKDFYYWFELGYSKKEAVSFTLKKYAVNIDLYENYSKQLDKLIEKNAEILERYKKQNRSTLNANDLKL